MNLRRHSAKAPSSAKIREKFRSKRDALAGRHRRRRRDCRYSVRTFRCLLLRPRRRKHALHSRPSSAGFDRLQSRRGQCERRRRDGRNCRCISSFPSPLPAISTGPGSMAFLDGVERACREFGVSLVGGDSSSADRIFVDVSMIGRVRTGGAVRRSGAQAGRRHLRDRHARRLRLSGSNCLKARQSQRSRRPASSLSRTAASRRRCRRGPRSRDDRRQRWSLHRSWPHPRRIQSLRPNLQGPASCGRAAPRTPTCCMAAKNTNLIIVAPDLPANDRRRSADPHRRNHSTPLSITRFS